MSPKGAKIWADVAGAAHRNAGFYLYESYLRLASLVARPVFARRMRPRSVH